MKLNLGSGGWEIDGYTPVDRKLGSEVYPLSFADGSVEVIRASHVLEHFNYYLTLPVLADWVRVLQPGGILKIAVPDVDWIVKKYEAGEGDRYPLEQYIVGGQGDEDDLHKALFNRNKLSAQMDAVGLLDIRPWVSEIEDCASYEVSLNLQGRKP